MSGAGLYLGKRVIVLDLETQKSFAEVDRSKLHQLKISVVGIYDSQSNEYVCYEEKELPQLERRLKAADLIVGFNIIDFDMRVLGPHLLTDERQFKILDILVEFHKVKGHRISLQALAQASLQDSKSGSGFDAIQLYRDGRIEDLKRYCLDDVRITKEIFDFGLKNKCVKYFSKNSFMNEEVPIDWSHCLQESQPEEKFFPSSLF